MDWKNKTVLVTGAGGFIGSHLVESLLIAGAKVRGFVRYNSRGDIGFLRMCPTGLTDKLEIIPGDLRDRQAIYESVRGCETVFHLGALISIPYSYHHPAEVADVNFLGTLNVTMACRDNNVRRMIHTSTSEVYGTARRVPIDEEHPLQGQSPYSASKIGADKMVESFFYSYDLPVVTVRPFNTFGPRQSARAVIPAIITQALVNDSISLGNLDSTRDFTFVSDTVSGFLAAAETPGVEGNVFNLGTGQEIRIGDMAQKIVHLMGKTIHINIDSDRLRPGRSEVMRLISDNRSAQDKLGWIPLVSLDEGLNRTIDWIRSNLNLYKPDRYEF
jgi:dTDP-glucose 4,6-dehydratase